MSTEPVSPPTEVFLSHSTEDFDFAARLVEFFRNRSIKTFFAPRHMNQALWHDEIGAALTRCDWFVVVLSPAAVRSMWVQREFMFALTEERFRDRIVPILWRACDLDRFSWTLRSFQRISFDVDFATGAEELCRRMGIPTVPISLPETGR